MHATLALELVAKLRTRGGAWRLVQTGLLVSSPMFLAIGIAAMSPITIVLAGLATGVLGRNLVQNARAIRAAEFSSAVETLGGKQLAAVIEEGTLRIGNADTPPERWPALRVTAREERKLRQLALPAARVLSDRAG